MNRNLFGALILVCIFFISFLFSCSARKERYDVQFIACVNGDSTRCSKVVMANSYVNASNLVKNDYWLKADTIIIKNVYIIQR